jgi:hypothetical protein
LRKHKAAQQQMQKMIGFRGLLSLFVCCCFSVVVGERVHREFEVPDKRFGQMFNFGFLPGGSARVQLESSSDTAQLAFLLCTEVGNCDRTCCFWWRFFFFFFFSVCQSSAFSFSSFLNPLRHLLG